MNRLVAGPQTDHPTEVGCWSIYAAIAFGIFLTIFFVLLGVLYYSVVMVALGGTCVVAYFAFLYYGPTWTKYDERYKDFEEGKPLPDIESMEKEEVNKEFEKLAGDKEGETENPTTEWLSEAFIVF